MTSSSLIDQQVEAAALKVGVRDRLSALPDSLILEILSLLETRYAVRTTFLSKRWRDLWTTVPRLKFVHENPHFIYRVLVRWRGAKIVGFYLQLSYEEFCFSDVDSWLLFTVEKQVEELHIIVLSFDRTPYYCPPQRLYSCSSITELHLGCYCSLEIGGSVQWNRLKSLCIKVPNSSCDDAVNKLLLGAPCLEEMTLSVIVKSDENFSIRSISLKKLKIDGPVDVKAILSIWAPNLLTLVIGEYVVAGGGCLFYVPSLTKAFLTYKSDYPTNQVSYQTLRSIFRPLHDDLEVYYQILRSICHVKEVTFRNCHIESLLDMKKKYMVLQFPNVEFLMQEWDMSVYCLLDLLGLLEMFPQLKTFVFRLDKALHNLKPIFRKATTFPRAFLFHLNTVEITWFAEDPSIFESIEYLLRKAPFLHKMVLHLVYYRDNHELFLMAEEKVRSLPRCSPTVELIIIEHVALKP
ncbi:F-box protein At5g03100-like [Salvia miltiorrhiza]|uniref:F-box protein At5g03100-like n=1 Tax=Salvia miltiorrhiza TaxID=226208 RepID=UPI0025AB9867|nr:F-box protein At5g03100-like [Salvia miltiorrhiza]